MIITDVLLFILGAALVIFGADWLVDGASGIARRFGLSEFVIGATIVGIGTSMPEFVVSAIAAFGGNADISIGNVSGSNIFNTVLILGITALILPLSYTSSNIKRDIPLCIGVSLLFLLFALGGTIGRIEGAVLFLGFIAYLIYCFKQDQGTGEAAEQVQPMPLWKSILLIAAGFAGLIWGGNMFVDHAVNIARYLHVSDAVIAITIMAGGTSLPELAVCVVAAAKGREQMAIGNIIGSNISNILLIVGFAALVTPLNVNPVNMLSITAVAISAAVLLLSALPLRTKKLTRWEGAAFILLYALYIALVLRNGAVA